MASSNTKPRRAHFNVRHGTSGHKALPMVKEEENENEIGIYSDPSLFRTANIQPIAPASFTINRHKKNKTLVFLSYIYLYILIDFHIYLDQQNQKDRIMIYGQMKI